MQDSQDRRGKSLLRGGSSMVDEQRQDKKQDGNHPVHFTRSSSTSSDIRVRLETHYLLSVGFQRPTVRHILARSTGY